MRGQLKAAGLAVAVALSTTGITGCQSTEEGVLTIGATAAPPTLDLVSNAAAAIPQVLLYNVYETLIRVDDSGKLVGLLAKSWQLSEDGLHLLPPRSLGALRIRGRGELSGGEGISGADESRIRQPRQPGEPVGSQGHPYP